MTKMEFFSKLSAKEWELLCSKAEFLEVFVAKPFNAEQVEAVAQQILNFDSPHDPSPLEN